MNRVLFLAFLLVCGIAFLSLRRQKLKFEIEFELEPKEEKPDDGDD